jgi:hypothetical protein
MANAVIEGRQGEDALLEAPADEAEAEAEEEASPEAVDEDIIAVKERLHEVYDSESSENA